MMNSHFFNVFALIRPGLQKAPLQLTLFRNEIIRLPHERCLRIQAYVDGELTPRRALLTAKLLADDPDAQSILMHLSGVKFALAGNELKRLVPQSRKLYWTAIEQAIASPAERQTRKRLSRPKWLWRLSPACTFLLSVCALWLNSGSPP